MARAQRMSLLTLSAHRTHCEQPSDTIHDELRFIRFRKWAGVTKVRGFASGTPNTSGQDHVNVRGWRGAHGDSAKPSINPGMSISLNTTSILISRCGKHAQGFIPAR